MVSVSEKIELHPAIHVSGDHMCKPCQMTRVLTSNAGTLSADRSGLDGKESRDGSDERDGEAHIR